MRSFIGYLVLALVVIECTNSGRVWLASAKKIAVIGAGISGSFVSHYLSEYDTHCQATGIDVYYDDSSSSQGSRVSSFKLPDGRIVELGASILHSKFHAVIDLIRKANLTIAKPMSTGRNETNLRGGLGIYDHEGSWSLKENSEFSVSFRLALRYGWDLLKIQRTCKKTIAKFDGLAPMLFSNEPDTFFASPEEIWARFNLDKVVHASFDSLLDKLSISNSSKWWLPGSGSLRRELLEAVNLNNYNQNNSQMNALTGLGTFSAITTKLFSIEGGNDQLITAAFDLAHQDRKSACRSDKSDLQMVNRRVTTIVGKIDGMYLYSGSDIVGQYDMVVLATPIQFSNISFLVPSQFDSAVLQPMPLGNLIDAHGEVPDNHEGHSYFSDPVATRRYMQVVTTIVWDAALNASVFHAEDESMLPKTILMTVAGKAKIQGIFTVSQLGNDVYKVFSDEPLSTDQLFGLFGKTASHYVKVWGGQHGGATPDYEGNGDATPFLIYDGAAGLWGHTNSGAMYYPVAMEQSALASMEMAAIGAKATAKLIAKRLGWIKEAPKNSARDEL
jgi:Prenylcysteine lyase/NAD(P)-binding Rossmann-like domain